MPNITPTIVLMYYDYPQVFIGKDSVDLQYCCMAVSENEYGPEYLCTPISHARRNQLISNGIELRQVFLNPESSWFFEASFNLENPQSITLNKHEFETCPEELLPADGLFFDQFDEVASKALELNATVSYASLSVAEAKHEARIRSNTLSEFLTLYQNTIKHLAKNIAKESKKRLPADLVYGMDVFGFSQGSFTIHLRSSYESDLLGENALLQVTLKRLGEFLNLIEKPKNAIEFLQSVKGYTAGSLIKLLTFLADNECPLKQRWSSPGHGESYLSITSTAHTLELLDLCRQREDLTEEIVILSGFVTSANSTTNTWRILNDDNRVYYSGDIKEGINISMQGIVIGERRYKFHCEEKIEVNTGTGRETVHLSLFNIEEIAS